MNNNLSFLGQHLSSARQASDLMQTLQRQAEVAAIYRRGAEAQVKSSKILEEQREELEMMRASIKALLKHNLEQSEQQEIKSLERSKIEAARYNENLKFSKIAAWTGVIGLVFAIVSIILQFVL